MTPGPTQILKIPPSGQLVKMASIASGNTFGARFWTDGKQEAPMLPDQPWLRCHPVTRELFWTDECEEVAVETSWSEQSDYRDVPFAEAPTLDDYRRSLGCGVVTSPEKQRYVLLRFWWAGNDPFRHGEAGASFPPDLHGHLLQFLGLLDTSDPHQRLLAAEALRQMSEFAKAGHLLDFQFPSDYQHAVGLIRKLTREGDSRVHEIV